VVFRAPAVLAPVRRLAVLFLRVAVLRLAVDLRAAVLRLAAPFRAAVFRFAVVVRRFAAPFLAAVFRFAVVVRRFAAVLRVPTFRLAVLLRAPAVLRAAVLRLADDFLRRAGFRAAELFVAAAIRVPPFALPLRRHPLQASTFPLAHTAPHPVPLIATQRVVQTFDANGTLRADTLRLPR
jgi:hypothetical protein